MILDQPDAAHKKAPVGPTGIASPQPPFSDRLKNVLLGLAAVISSVAIPLVGIYYTNQQKNREIEVGDTRSRIEQAQKERELAKGFIELGLKILSDPPLPATKPLRSWAIDIINHYAEVAIPPDVKQALLTDQSLPSLSSNSSSSPIGSIWEHNGSTVQLISDGSKRRFVYEQPRDALASVGVSKGSLLFDGVRTGNVYVGNAYLATEKCGIRTFSVSGTFSANERQITLKGTSPRLDANCQVAGSEQTTLVFDYHEPR